MLAVAVLFNGVFRFVYFAARHDCRTLFYAAVVLVVLVIGLRASVHFGRDELFACFAAHYISEVV